MTAEITFLLRKNRTKKSQQLKAGLTRLDHSDVPCKLQEVKNGILVTYNPVLCYTEPTQNAGSINHTHILEDSLHFYQSCPYRNKSSLILIHAPTLRHAMHLTFLTFNDHTNPVVWGLSLSPFYKSGN